ncbi:hypothetical protein KKI90_12825 [Xenorhabdus bovienii]|uniref:Uncharacterized protein n=1 Tax=Xenorhabdus bovienii TaxID=40576 RepID=A0AAJ1JAW9_XENBV|nr:hypothetical protein [Xenorhabdus bovienii]MDE1479401.1 hypothetical protein [Xenorhabdus bovienii]MDE1487287.1 hypothetical protein [Xenorhabdus bovienii]MDE1492570.1 hypothetical protein [Xenorhabdus bovienii]MDE9511143.1 hypothetical protein [Xenorhabdus bovienii]MDE9522800.1 hypothetical protein [Xenorhabdus bovienii]
MTDLDVCREAFEKFMVDGFNYPIDSLGKYDDGTYWNMPAQNYWEIFQAAWNASRECGEDYERGNRKNGAKIQPDIS